MDTGDEQESAAADSSVHKPPITVRESALPAKRIVEVIGSEPVTAFARRCGFSEGLLRKYIKGSMPGADNAHRISAAAGVTLDWLITGRGPKFQQGRADPDYVYLPLHRNVSASAGNGSVVWDEYDIDHIAFQTSFIRHELRANPQSLRLVRVSGDSMERLLYSGDMVMVDTSITALQAEGMYVFRIDDSISVKWLYAMPGGIIRVVSENSAKYPPYEITKKQAHDHHFQIIGLVRWWAHTQR